MLKIGDKCKWSAKALRAATPIAKQRLRKEKLTVAEMLPDRTYKYILAVTRPYHKGRIGYYALNYFEKL